MSKYSSRGSQDPWQRSSAPSGRQEWHNGWEGWADNPPTTPPALGAHAGVRRADHDCLARSAGQSTAETVICQRRSQKMLSVHASSKKGNASHEAMEALTQARGRQEEVTSRSATKAAEAETMFDGTTKNTLVTAQALEIHAKTVTIRAESLATTDADFFKTHLHRQEEAQEHLNELSAQLGTFAAAVNHEPKAA